MNYDFVAVKSRILIEDLFRADGHELKKRGSKYVCLSPFQTEKTPSCYVDPARGRFKCFSTGSSGDIFDFVMLSRSVELEEAMRLLAEQAHLDFKDGSRPLPAPIRPAPKIEVEKTLSAIIGEDLAIWTEGVEKLKASRPACPSIATWRGFSTDSVQDLAVQGKIGSPKLSPWLRKQDREQGDRRVAFPVEAYLEDGVTQVGGVFFGCGS